MYFNPLFLLSLIIVTKCESGFGTQVSSPSAFYNNPKIFPNFADQYRKLWRDDSRPMMRWIHGFTDTRHDGVRSFDQKSRYLNESEPFNVTMEQPPTDSEILADEFIRSVIRSNVTFNSSVPSYDQFCLAVDTYSVTTYGGHPPKPNKRVYDLYMKIVGSHMPPEEQAMFLANIIWETGGLQYMEEIACKDGSCVYGAYYGRGYIQLTWDYNYRDASFAIFGDDRLLRRPNLVTHPKYAWITALYYWITHVRPFLEIYHGIRKHYFGITVQAINGGIECSGTRYPNRLLIYNEILYRWNISKERPGRMVGCWYPFGEEPEGGDELRMTTATATIPTFDSEMPSTNSQHATTPFSAFNASTTSGDSTLTMSSYYSISGNS